MLVLRLLESKPVPPVKLADHFFPEFFNRYVPVTSGSEDDSIKGNSNDAKASGRLLIKAAASVHKAISGRSFISTKLASNSLRLASLTLALLTFSLAILA